MQAITSKENTGFKHVKALLTQPRQRKKQNETVLEGVHLLQSFANAKQKPKQIWLSESATAHAEVLPLLKLWEGIPTFLLADGLYKQLRTIGDGVDVLAVIEQPKYSISQILEDALILNDVQDAGNVGTLCRTASAVGIRNIVCTEGTASLWSPKCLRAGMGAQFSLQIYENISIEAVLEYVKIPLLATSSHTQQIIYKEDLAKPLAWIMGNEGQGVHTELMQQAKPIALPQKGEESLNVAVAGALCMYEMLRQREFSHVL